MMALQAATRRIRSRRSSGLVALLAGVLVAIIGVIVASSSGWSTGAYWGIAIVASLLATLGYAIPQVRRAPRIVGSTVLLSTESEAPGSAPMDVAPKELAVGLATEPVLTDALGLKPQRVIVLTGHTTSGKTRIAERMHQDHPDWGWASCAAYVKAQARQRGIESAPPVTDTFGQQLVDELGGAGFLDGVIVNADLPSDPKTLLIDDVYHAEVYEAIQTRWPHLQFVSIDLSQSMRERLSGGAAPTDPNPLNEAFSALTAIHAPDVTLEAAQDDTEVRERTRQLEVALAA